MGFYIGSKTVYTHETSLWIRKEDAQKMNHLIAIMDNGIGFDQEDAERNFQVFTRLYGNAGYKGTGMGLSIVKQVVENHHGYIWAEGTPGVGFTFKLLLPAE